MKLYVGHSKKQSPAPCRYDCHVHFDIQKDRTPTKIYAARHNWDLDLLERLIRWHKKAPYFVRFLLFVYNLFARDIRVEAFLRYYMNPDPKKKQIAEMKKAGIGRAFGLHIDYRPFAGDSIRETARYLDNLQYISGDPFIVPFEGYSGGSRAYYLLSENVKVYPATLTAEELRAVQFDPRVKRFVVHCSTGGIGKNKALNSPLRWIPVLLERPEIKVMFAHYGGGRDEWRKAIREMMLEFRAEDGRARVYADCSFHTGAIFNSVKYFMELRKEIDLNPDCICFGSDFPLHTIFYSYKKLVKSFLKHLGKFYWDTITIDNPRGFLS